ncbi:Uncharacterized protein PBTT_08752 [Plasmodiophora brassicae]
MKVGVAVAAVAFALLLGASLVVADEDDFRQDKHHREDAAHNEGKEHEVEVDIDVQDHAPVPHNHDDDYGDGEHHGHGHPLSAHEMMGMAHGYDDEDGYPHFDHHHDRYH